MSVANPVMAEKTEVANNVVHQRTRAASEFRLILLGALAGDILLETLTAF